MNKTKYLKGACQNCDGHLEFLAEHIGMTVPCPHCGTQTELSLLAPPQEPTVPRRALIWTATAAVILGLGLVGALVALKRAEKWAQQQKQQAVAASAATVISPPPELPIPQQNTNSLAQQGLEASEVTLEKTAGSSLIYAAGTIKNTTDRQRFGLKVELELLNATGKKLGSASDYRQVLEPGAQWQFKALVVDAKTVSARISSVREDQ
jgi:hypothetical protein